MKPLDHAAVLAALTAALCSCAPVGRGLSMASAAPPVALDLKMKPDRTVALTYRLVRPTDALHFAQELGGYRAEDWRVEGGGFRWIKEGGGERVVRADGSSFDAVTFSIPIRYRFLPKNHAPFSPFSEGSTLIHTGQFHACTSAPCAAPPSVMIDVTAIGKTIGAGGRRSPDRTRYLSRDDGTNLFVGTLSPVAADGFVAIVDPGLPPAAQDHLKASLPRAMGDLASVYGPLSFRPELYVSIDARPRDDGRISTQGGTLPGQIYMHFDGANARQRVAEGSPFWLDWFFAHEAAHLFQQDKVGKLTGDDAVAWIHEGGADALAALMLVRRGADERAYVGNRLREAEAACAKGLATSPLDQATASGDFDRHYQCGLLIWLAMDAQLRAAGHDGLHALNKRFFASVAAGAAWNERTFMAAARSNGVPGALLETIGRLSHGGYSDAQAEVAALRSAMTPGPVAQRTTPAP